MLAIAMPQKFRTDNQFLDSANGISVFLEEKAMDADNKLGQPKSLAVNKIGHAMHDLDPVFRDFSRSVLQASGLLRGHSIAAEHEVAGSCFDACIAECCVFMLLQVTEDAGAVQVTKVQAAAARAEHVHL